MGKEKNRMLLTLARSNRLVQSLDVTDEISFMIIKTQYALTTHWSLPVTKLSNHPGGDTFLPS